MFLKDIFLVPRTLLTVVGMVVSILWRFRYVTVLIVGAAIAAFRLILPPHGVRCTPSARKRGPDTPPPSRMDSAGWLCHGNANEPALRAKLAKRHAAATAPCHCAVASARKIRSVDREMRWRCRLKVLWTAACMLRKRWADRADLKRCCLRSRRRTA